MKPVLNCHSCLNVRKCVRLWKLKKGSWINVQCIVILWCFVKFIQRKKLLISPTKLFNLGMTNNFHIHLKFFPKGLYTDSIKKNIKNALSEESDIVANFSPLLSLWRPSLWVLASTVKEREDPCGVGEEIEFPEVFLAQKVSLLNQLSTRLRILTFAWHLHTKQIDCAKLHFKTIL